MTNVTCQSQNKKQNTANSDFYGYLMTGYTCLPVNICSSKHPEKTCRDQTKNEEIKVFMWKTSNINEMNGNVTQLQIKSSKTSWAFLLLHTKTACLFEYWRDTSINERMKLGFSGNNQKWGGNILIHLLHTWPPSVRNWYWILWSLKAAACWTLAIVTGVCSCPVPSQRWKEQKRQMWEQKGRNTYRGVTNTEALLAKYAK